MQWTFENYRLDTDDAALWQGDEQVALRPKTFDVLRYLVEHAGQLVRKETLLENVWGNSFVVEGVLTTSMSELRKLFGDTAANQRFIATVYRRGYRFVADVQPVLSDADLAAPIASDAEAPVIPEGASQLRFPRTQGFVGRQRETDRLVRWLANDPGCRIMTLVGPGGIGKTQLALNVLAMLSELDEHPFTDGFCAVALQSLDPGDDLHTAMAESLDLRLSGDATPQQQVQDFLRQKQLLVLLDNFEHLLEQAPALVDLIDAAPGVKLLVTSRESLPLREAWFHPVDGLDYSDALRLFAQEARRNQPEFDVQARMPLVLRICQLVEGMPLALELAANWLKMLSMEEVVNEILAGLDILSDQDGSHADRHRSLRAVFLETWQRLTESERTLLKQFAVFRGGADRAAITAIIGAGLPLLATLVNKSLLRTTASMRYRMHELIRQFAEEQLERDPLAEKQARNRHAEYYLGWLEGEWERLRSPDQGEACMAIQANIDNLRLAWRQAVAVQRFDLIDGALRTLSLYCDLRGQFADGLALFAQAREALVDSGHDALLARLDLRSAILDFRLSRYDKALASLRAIEQGGAEDYERALCLRFLGDYHFSHAGLCRADQAVAYLEESIALCERLGDRQLHTECLCELAIVYANLRIDMPASRDHATQAVALARASGRPDQMANSLDVLAWTTNHQGDYAAAEATWREVFDIAYRSGNRSLEALATNWLGWSAWSEGGARHDEAAQLFSDALLRYRNLGDRANQSMTYADLASVQLETGDYAAALDNCRRGLELARQIGREDHYVYNLYTRGALECAMGELEASRQSLDEALHLAWEQEEETNKPVVLYYIALLWYAEYRAEAESRPMAEILDLLTFIYVQPATWQTFRDRVKRLRKRIAEESETELDEAGQDRDTAAIVTTFEQRLPDLFAGS